MHWLVQIMLSDAAGAAVLAALVWLVSLICRRPAVVRALWIVVLLKLLTPPLWTVPVDRLMARQQAAALPGESIVASTASVAPVELRDVELQAAPEPAVPVRPRVSIGAVVLHWLPVLWLTGSGVLLAIGLVRVLALRRVLRKSASAPHAVQWQTAVVAQRLGLTRPPQVWFVPGAVCPALWAFGRGARIIIPIGLWDRLDEAQRQTLLAHELAHLRRRDHWVRLLEVFATILYWWHPAVWVARRQIHDCEEQCCDAWVLWAMPASAHSYGSALLEAVDFVSMYRPMRPALSAGLGEFRHLKRRLLMIRQGKVARALSRSGLLGIFAAAAVVLPVGPVFGQEVTRGTAQTAEQDAKAQSSSDAERAARHDARVAVAEARERVAQLQRELAEAISRLELLEHSAGVQAGGGTMPYGIKRYADGRVEAYSALPPSEHGPATGGIGGGGGGGGMGGGGYIRSGAAGGANFGGRAGVGRPGIAGGGGGFGGGTMGPAGGGGSVRLFGGRTASGAASTDVDQRLDRLDKQLRELMAQVRELKQQKTNDNHDEPEQNRPPVGF